MYKYKYKFRCHGSSGTKFWQPKVTKKKLSDIEIDDIKQRIHENFGTLENVYLKEIVKLEKVLVFSKSEFRSNADVHVQRTLSPHLDILDGTLVHFYEDDSHGEVLEYEAEGKTWCLYPVCEEWCTNEQQMTLL